MPSHLPHLLAALLTLTALGCQEDSVACTQIGCETQIQFNVFNAQGQPFTGFYGSVNIGGQNFNVSCGSAEGSNSDEVLCVQGGFTVRLSSVPNEASVNLRDADASTALASIGGVAVTDINTFRPNGPDCEPECTQGRARVTMEVTQAGNP
jgi:hypothetical protein